MPRIRRRGAIGLAVVAAAVFGLSSPALAVDGEENPPTAAPGTQEPMPPLPADVWTVITGHLPQELQAIAPLRLVSFTHRAVVDKYLETHPHPWRMLPTATLEWLLMADVPDEWKTIIDTHVLVPDKARKQGEECAPLARIVETQEELKVALTDPARHNIWGPDSGHTFRWTGSGYTFPWTGERNMVAYPIHLKGSGKFDLSGFNHERHTLRLYDNVQVSGLHADTLYAYNQSQVHGVSHGSWVVAYNKSQVHEVTGGEVGVHDEAQVHGVSKGGANAHGNAQVHGVTGGMVTADGQAQVYGVTGGEVRAKGEAKVYGVVGGTVEASGQAQVYRDGHRAIVHTFNQARVH